MTEQYNLQGNTSKFFVNYLVVKRPIYNKIISENMGEKTNLTDKPLMVLASLLYLDYMFQKKRPSLTESERMQFIESKSSKKKIASNLGLTDVSRVNNYLSHLRRMGIIKKDGMIDDRFKINPEEEVIVEYKINVNG